MPDRRPLASALALAAASIGLFYLGPLPWPSRSSPRLALLLASFWMAFTLGYLMLNRMTLARRGASSIGGRSLILWGFIANAVTLPLSLQANVGIGLTDINLNVSDQGEAYLQRQEWFLLQDGVSGTQFLLLFLRAAASPIVVAGLAVALTGWKGLTWRLKLVTVSSLAIQLLLSFARGTDKEVVDLIVLLLVTRVLLAGKRLGMRRLLGFSVAVVLALSLFGARRTARQATPDFCIQTICADSTSSAGLPQGLHELHVQITSYASQGYHGMYLADGQPHRSRLGLSSFPIIDRLFSERFFGLSFEDKLQANIEGWPDENQWFSAFTDLAGDFGFDLVAIPMFGLGALCCWSYRRARHDDLSAILVLTYIFVFIIYAPANNQLGTSLEAFVQTAFWCSFFLFRELHTTQNDQIS